MSLNSFRSDLLDRYFVEQILTETPIRQLKPLPNAVAPKTTTLVSTSSPKVTVTSDSKTNTTTTTTTASSSWTPSTDSTLVSLSASSPNNNTTPIIQGTSTSPWSGSSAGTTPTSTKNAVAVRTETTIPTSSPAAASTESPRTSTTKTSFLGILQPTPSPTPATPGPTPPTTVAVGINTTSGQARTPVVFTEGPMSTSASIAGSDTTTTTTRSTSTGTTEVKTNATTLAVSTASGGTATAISTQSSAPILSTSTSPNTSHTSTTGTTVYTAGKSTNTTTTTTKATATSGSITTISTTSTAAASATDGQSSTSITTTNLTDTTSSVPTGTVITATTNSTKSTAGASTGTPTYSLGTTKTVPTSTSKPANTDSNTTISFETTAQGTKAVVSTTLPGKDQSTTNVNLSFGPGAESGTTSIVVLANTSTASNSNDIFLEPAGNITSGSSGPESESPLQLQAESTETKPLSLETKLMIFFGTLSLVGAIIVIYAALNRQGSALSKEVTQYDNELEEGKPLTKNTEKSLLIRGERELNRLAYWLQQGEQWGFTSDAEHKGIGAAFKDIVERSKALKVSIADKKDEALRLAGREFVDLLELQDTWRIEPPTLQGIRQITPIHASTVGRPYEPALRPPLSPPDSTPSSSYGTPPSSYGAPDSIELTTRTADGTELRRLAEIPIIQTQDIRIVELWSLITKAQQLPYSDQSRTDMLMQAFFKYQQIISSGNIYLYDFDTLQNKLMPTLLKELSDLTLMAADSDPSARLTGAETLNVGRLDSKQFNWDVNFTPSERPIINWAGKDIVQFMDINKAVFNNQPVSFKQQRVLTQGYSKAAKSVVLDEQHSQYIASDGNEFIAIGGDLLATGPTNYNVAGMAGNDIFSISADTLGENSYINLFGGGGENTYIISGKGSWSKLASTIHIWDFNSSKDTIMLVTSDGAINLKETKRTLFRSTYSLKTLNETQLFIQQQYEKLGWVTARIINFNYDQNESMFKAAQHEFTGEGMPVIVVDEQNFSKNNPDSIFNALKTLQPNHTTGQLYVSTSVNTQFGQLNTEGEQKQYKVRLTAGQSYVFTMSGSPNVDGNAVLDTRLILKDAKNYAVAKGTIQKGNSRIDYVALNDGDYYLEASKFLPNRVEHDGRDLRPVKTLSSLEGKYAISAVEIPHMDAYPTSMKSGSSHVESGNFDGQTNHVGYKMSLSAGDYIDLKFWSDKAFPKFSITNTDGDKITPRETRADGVQNDQSFLAQKTGIYFIDATVNNDLITSSTPYQLRTTKNRDIEKSIKTMADLSINTVITSNLYDNQDHDWFKVSLLKNKKYQFDLRKGSESSSLDTYLRLQDSNGKELASHDDIDGSYDRNSRLIYSSAASGSYFVDVASWAEKSSGTYALSYKII